MTQIARDKNTNCSWRLFRMHNLVLYILMESFHVILQEMMTDQTEI